MKPTPKALGTEPLKLKYEELLSIFAFECNLRRYTAVDQMDSAAVRRALDERGLPTSGKLDKLKDRLAAVKIKN
jgi:hypothetical protein